MSWKDYVNRHMTGRTQKDLADLAGVSQTAVSRWRSGTQGADARAAMDLARGVGEPPIAALVAAGFLTADEAKQRPTAAPSLDSLSNDELLAEIRRRMSEREVVADGDTAPIADEVSQLEPGDGAARTNARSAAPKSNSAPQADYAKAAQSGTPRTRANRARRREEKNRIPGERQGEAPEGGA